MSFGLIINHNLGSMNALSALNGTQNALQTELQQLSTGKQINSAADNAAGYAISQKMQAQIDGLSQASQNSQDGISLLQTANGALNETQSILQRMRQLAVQSANGTNTSTDRTSLQDEVTQLTSEIDNIANTTQFNTMNLLNGGAGVQTTVTGDPNGAVSVVGGSANTEVGAAVTVSSFTAATSASQTMNTAMTGAGDTVGAASTLTIDGTTFNFSTGESASQVIDQINNANIGVTAKEASTGKLEISTTNVGSAAQLTISGSGDFATGAGNVWNAETAGTDASATLSLSYNGGAATTVNANVTGDTFTIADATNKQANGLEFNINPTSFGTESATIAVNSNGALQFQIGANQNQTMALTINSMTSQALGVSNIDVSNQSNAEAAISTLDTAITTVSQQQAQLGAYQNRLQDTINNVDTASQNLTTAQAGITDTNMAQAMANFTKDNVLQQAAISMLAQANQQPQLVLKLLG